MMIWTKYRSVAELPPSLWNDLIAKGSVSLDERLIKTVEEVYSEDHFHYFLCTEAEKTCALFFVKESKEKICRYLPLSFRVGYSATSETSGAHYWFDPHLFSYASFTAATTEVFQRELPHIPIWVWQDISEQERSLWEPSFVKNGWIGQSSWEVSVIENLSPFESLDLYKASLPSKYRNEWRKASSSLNDSLYQIETIEDFLPLLDQLYPLYLSVASRAKEYAGRPHEKSFFKILKKHFGQDCRVVSIQEKSSCKILGFMLLIYSRSSCLHYYIGFEPDPTLYLWHNLTIGSIDDAIRRKTSWVDMGVTNAKGKKQFGAIPHSTYLFYRIFPPLLNRILGKLPLSL